MINDIFGKVSFDKLLFGGLLWHQQNGYDENEEKERMLIGVKGEESLTFHWTSVACMARRHDTQQNNIKLNATWHNDLKQHNYNDSL